MTQVTIDRLGHLGDGIAAGPIFVAGVLPGEVVQGTLNGTRLDDPRIITPSADRVKPPCTHAKSCGGCAMQHARDPFVQHWKEGIIRSALTAQGITEPPFKDSVTCPPNSRRRATFAARRTKGGVLIGFHTRASDTIIPIPECQLLDPKLKAALPALTAIVQLGVARGSEANLHVTQSLSGLDIAVTGGKAADGAMMMALASCAGAHGIARLAWNGDVIAQETPPLHMMGRAHVAPPSGAFLQPSAAGENALLSAVKMALTGVKGRVFDLFAGCGTFSLPLAEAYEIRAYEGDAAMIGALSHAARHTDGLRPIHAETRDLFRRPLEPDELNKAQAVVIDPPRAGAEAQCTTLAQSKTPVIAMVSCSPQSFARDAAILIKEGYRLDWVQMVDQFRWSAHVELVARFSR